MKLFNVIVVSANGKIEYCNFSLEDVNLFTTLLEGHGIHVK